MPKVAVTGAAGFIGRWTVGELLERDHVVVGLDDFSNGSTRNLEAFESDERLKIIEGDVRNRSDICTLIDGNVDACIHLAAEIDVHESLEDPGNHFETNVLGTHHVLEACRRHDVRLGLMGTCMVYALAETDVGISEAHPVEPASPYAGTKLAAENIAESYYHGYDLPVVLLRPFNTYGPYQTQGVVPTFIERDLRKGTIEIYGDGTQTRDLLYVTDCAEFVVDATLSDAAVGEVLNAGTGTDHSINELAERIATGKTTIEHVEHHHPQSEIPKLRADSSKARDLLGWEPRVSLEDGIQRLRTWLQNKH